jgi:hypothetical protein
VKKLRFKDTELFGIAVASGLIGLIVDDWIGGAATIVLWLGAKLLITGDGIPVLFLAFLYQWMQVTVGLFYFGFLGRAVPTVYLSDYRPMVLIGLGCVLSIAVGIRAGIAFVRKRMAAVSDAARPVEFLSWALLLTAYGVGVVFEGSLVYFSGAYPSLRQVFLTFTVVRMGLLFLIFRRLSHPTFYWLRFTVLMAFEVALGFTGFFAGFREPLALGVMALLEIFNYRRTSHLVTVAGMLAAMAVASVTWMGVRDSFRRDFTEVDAFSKSQSARMDRISSLGSGFFKSDFSEMVDSADKLIDREWAIYYPALAVARVPSVIPHTDGSIALAAVKHALAPRMFFPSKSELISDSEMVRKYSGVWVAGRDEGTSIAFGYAVEMFVDFGVPVMFLPVVLFGLLTGAAYGGFNKLIRHRELAVATMTVIFWLSLYPFERSTANMVGFELSYVVYLGIPAILLDRFLLMKGKAVRRSNVAYVVHPASEAMPVVDRLR